MSHIIYQHLQSPPSSWTLARKSGWLFGNHGFHSRWLQKSIPLYMQHVNTSRLTTLSLTTSWYRFCTTFSPKILVKFQSGRRNKVLEKLLLSLLRLIHSPSSYSRPDYCGDRVECLSKSMGSILTNTDLKYEPPGSCSCAPGRTSVDKMDFPKRFFWVILLQAFEKAQCPCAKNWNT